MEIKKFESKVFVMKTTTDTQMSVQKATPRVEGEKQADEIAFHLRDETDTKQVDLMAALSINEAKELITALQELTK